MSDQNTIPDADDEAKARAIAKMRAAIEQQKNKPTKPLKKEEAPKKVETSKTHVATKKQVTPKKHPVENESVSRQEHEVHSTISINTSSDEEDEQNSGLIKNVKVYSPFKTYFSGVASSISAENLTGPFDVLAGHKNFMTLLTACEVVIRTSRGEQKIKIGRGIMHVRNNAVSVFLDV